MMRTRIRGLLALVVALVLPMGLVACGGDDESSGGSGSSSSSSSSSGGSDSGKKLRIGMVTDIGGLNDRSFNASAYKGLKEAESKDGVEIHALTSNSNADYVPNLSSLARQKYDMVIG